MRNSITRRIAVIMMIACIVPAALLASPQAVFYVDPVNGDDAASGGSPTTAFATITRARDEVRTINASMTGDIGVRLMDGTFLIDETLVFGTQDSGSNGHKVQYTAASGSTPIISGGTPITGWALHDSANNIYRAPVGFDIETRELYINGNRAIRARSSGGLPNATNDDTGHTTTMTSIASWGNVSDIEMVYRELWTNPRVPVDSISVVSGKARIVMQQPGYYDARNKSSTSSTNPWYYENAYELLDQPGEWYLDRPTDTFYYIPRSGENMATAEVVASVVEGLILLEGESLSAPIEHIEFHGISFVHDTWLEPSSDRGHADAQNNVRREWSHPAHDVRLEIVPDGAITLKKARNVRFERNTFKHIGFLALKIAEGSDDNIVQGNVFMDIGGNGVMVGDVERGTTTDNYDPSDTRLILKNNDILNNYFQDIGVEYRSGSAIGAAYPQDMDISHNEIYNVAYIGIHVGWGWDFIPTSVLKNVTISYNRIENVMTDLQDGGAIYTLGPTSGSSTVPSVISHNYVKDVVDNGGYGSNGIYPDQGSQWWTIYDNVLENPGNLWLKVWNPNIEDVSAYDNFTNNSDYDNSGTRTTVTNTTVVSGTNWPSAATAIIDSAGLEAAYEDIRPAFTVDTFGASEDVYVQGGVNANTNYAAAGELLVKRGSNPDTLRKTYLKFDLSGQSLGSISQAEIQLYVEGSANPRITVYETLDSYSGSATAWEDESLTWNTAPPLGNSIASTSIGTSGTYYSWDVTEYVTTELAADGIISVALYDDSTSNDYVSFADTESGTNAPIMIIAHQGTSNPEPDPEPDPQPEEPITLEATEDVYIKGGTNSGTNYNGTGELVVKQGSVADTHRRIYLKFDLSDYTNATVSTATLELHLESSASPTLTVYRAADTYSGSMIGWTDDVLTWDNAPAPGATVDSTAIGTAARYYTWDVSEYVNDEFNGDGMITFVIDDASASNDYATFEDSETGPNQPQLIVNP